MTTAKPTSDSRVHEGIPAGTVEDLPGLVAQLGKDLVQLLDGKLGLFKLDLEDQARGYGRELLVATTAAIVIAGGVLLIAAGLAFALAYLLPSRLDPLLLRALAFSAVGGVLAAAGWVVLRRSGGRLGTKAARAVAPGSGAPGSRDV